MKKEAGFTVIELIIFFAILIVLGVFFWIQKVDLESSFDDQLRKTSINSIYYNLTEIYYPENNSYPDILDMDKLTAIDPELFIDPYGFTFGEADSDYSYEGLNCNNEGKCKDFRLSSQMEKESEYIRTAPSK